MKKTPYEVGGFAFTNEKAMEKAAKELEGAHYVRNGIDRNDPQMIFQVYCQMIEQQIFETPLGYTFLYELQEYLRANPTIHNEEIPSIPVISMENSEAKSRAKTNQPEKQPATKTRTRVVRKTKETNVDYKVWFRTSSCIGVILLIIVIGMFAVTATSDNINIVNYENALIEKYESWETKLNEKEDRLRERENALNEALKQEVTP